MRSCLVDLIEARVVATSLPRGARPLEDPARIVIRHRGSRWHLEAPLDEDVFPLARWLCDEAILDELGPGASLAIETLPSGEVALEVRAPRAAVERFLAWIRESARETRVRRVIPAEADGPRLTDLQLDALRRAVALGYYQVPRAIHLSELAAKLSVSPAALSERLRRAEARLVHHHVSRSAEQADDAAED